MFLLRKCFDPKISTRTSRQHQIISSSSLGMGQGHEQQGPGQGWKSETVQECYCKASQGNPGHLMLPCQLMITCDMQIMTENINGEGMDIPMLGIREALKEVYPDKDLPELFRDEVYQSSNLFQLSTSQVGIDWQESLADADKFAFFRSRYRCQSHLWGTELWCQTAMECLTTCIMTTSSFASAPSSPILTLTPWDFAKASTRAWLSSTTCCNSHWNSSNTLKKYLLIYIVKCIFTVWISE